jgi:uncharacterized membrane protein (DUF4010 family)
MVDSFLFFKFGAALFIGILTGLQREFTLEVEHREVVAGVRTFAILSLSGCASAMLADLLHSPLPFAAAVLAVGALLSVSHYVDVQQGRPGLTTKMASLFVVMAGGLAFWNVALAVALGVTTTVLLSIKPQTQYFVKHLTKSDIIATLKFAVITAIVLPVLPNRTFGLPPFDIFNPLKIWLIVVFISAISFVGYVLIKVAGTRRGIGLTGLLGGLVSSTAVTLSFSQRSHNAPELSRNLGMAIIIAWSVMYARVFTIAAVLNWELARILWIPTVVSIAVSLCWIAYLWLSSRKGENGHDITFSNPFELGPAIGFGLIFVVVLFVCKVAQVHYGNAGIYVSSLVSGLADVDAITLSMARLARGAVGVDVKVAMQAIVIATATNTILKGAIAVIGGTPGLRRAIIPATVVIAGAGAVAGFLIL